MDDNVTALINLKRLIANYNQPDLLAAIGGLQLLPENTNRLVRLETLSQVIASISYETGKPLISNPKLRKILNSYPIANSPIESAEDPCENLFTEAFSFHGGSYIIFPGIVEDSGFIMRHLVESLFISPQNVQDKSFLNEVRSLVESVLAVSDLIAHRANLVRGIEPKSPLRGNVVVPNSSRLSELKSAVTFTKDELKDLFHQKEETLNAFERIVTQAGIIYEKFDLESGELFSKPIVKFNDNYIVAMPSFLLVAARHAVIKLAIERNLLEKVVGGYADRLWLTVVESLDRLDNKPLPFPPPKHELGSCYRDGIFRLDTDKIVYVGLVVDPLTNYDQARPFHHWETGDLNKKLVQRWTEIEEKLLTSLPINDWLNIFLLHGMGRSAALGFNGSETRSHAPFAKFSVSDLESISWLEAGKQLLLWHYARASERVRQNTQVMVWSSLDEFQMYRLKNYSFYFSDDIRPSLLVIDPGTGGSLRLELAKKRDFHAVPSYYEGQISEVTTFHDTTSVPVYVDLKSLRMGQLALLVEGLPLNLWVISSKNRNEQSALRDLYFRLADAISHWLWQLTPALNPVLNEVVKSYEHLILEMYLIPSEDWTSNRKKEDTKAKPIDVVVDRNTGTLHITFNSSILTLLDGADNYGEREMMRNILSSFRQLLPDQSQEKLSDSAIVQMLDKHIPLGIKKKALILSSNTSPQLDERGLPGYHKVSEPSIEELLDELGEFLRTEKKLPEGRIPNEQRTKVLNEIVAYFYNRLEKPVGTLNPDGLLEWLIAQHESVIQEKAHNKLTTPTRLACFMSEPEMIEDMEKRLPELAKAGRDNRFLIEYVTARQPNGLRPISLSVYDELLALASEIVEFGMESDLIRLKLADFRYSMLPSGRFGADREHLTDAMKAYFPAYGLTELQQTKRGFSRYWRKLENPENPSEEFLKINAAAKIEFGHTLRELNELMVEAYNISQESDQTAVSVMVLPELINQLVSRLGWSEKKVADAFDLLSLKPRNQYLEPEPPFQRVDVYPWRYNRPLSYIRRPFLYRKRNGNVEILWGPRNLFDAMEYLTHLCLGGRLQAKSPEMRQYLGEINNERGDEFNSQVTLLFQEHEGLIVRERVKKIGNKRICNDGGELGDVDVLVANTRKKTVTVVECKDLALARTPNEMSNEILNLFQGVSGKKSIIEKHQKRIEWIKNNLEDVLDWLGVKRTGKWRVEGLIVVNRPLFTPYLQKSPIPVISYEELARKRL